MQASWDSSGDAALECAAQLLSQADALIIGAGAGIGIDSGLPDFRGPGGFWGAYPALGRAGLRFETIASPDSFHRHPRLAWGFYGHRLSLYRRIVPHEGFQILRRWGDAKLMGSTVFTSNIDGHFARAGFATEQIHECHGSIHLLQCLEGCFEHIWSAEDFEPQVDPDTCLLLNDPPRCPHCNSLARPNVLMFGDSRWIDRLQKTQSRTQASWLGMTCRPVVVEIGAGTAIPSVRHFSHHVIHRHGGRLIRINPANCAVPTKHDAGIPLPALEALRMIDQRLQALSS